MLPALTQTTDRTRIATCPTCALRRLLQGKGTKKGCWTLLQRRRGEVRRNGTISPDLTTTNHQTHSTCSPRAWKSIGQPTGKETGKEVLIHYGGLQTQAILEIIIGENSPVSWIWKCYFLNTIFLLICTERKGEGEWETFMKKWNIQQLPSAQPLSGMALLTGALTTWAGI